MRITHIAARFDSSQGGLASAIDAIVECQRGAGLDARLLTIESPTTLRRRWVDTVADDTAGPMLASRNFRRALAKIDTDIIHIHGLWLYPCHAAAKVARRRGIPYVVTPHGMLMRPALAIHSLKKRIARRLWFDRDLRHAAAIIFAGSHEWEMSDTPKDVARGNTSDNPYVLPSDTPSVKVPFGAIIGHPIVAAEIDSSPATRRNDIGFLGRLHPVKGLETLIDAFAAADTDMTLAIMGEGDKAYEAALRNRARRLGVENRIIFAGRIEGEEKWRRLSQLKALVAPSLFENFGMSIAESMACGTPVAVSANAAALLAAKADTPIAISDAQSSATEAGWIFSGDTDSLRRVIETIGAATPEQLDRLGARAGEIIARRYSHGAIAAEYSDLYRRIYNQYNS